MDANWRGEMIPKLSDVLEELPADGRIFIEIKDSVNIIEPLIQVVDNASVSRWQITVIAFDKEVVARVKEVFLGITVLWLVGFNTEGGSISPDADELIQELTPLMEPGDILAHPFTRHPGGFVSSKAGGFCSRSLEFNYRDHW